MIYEFSDEQTGEAVELWMPMSEAPRIGSVIEHEGRKLRREISSVLGFKREEICFASHQLPKGDIHHKRAGGAFDDKNRPVFTNRKQAQEYAARTEGVTTYGELD